MISEVVHGHSTSARPRMDFGYYYYHNSSERHHLFHLCNKSLHVQINNINFKQHNSSERHHLFHLCNKSLYIQINNINLKQHICESTQIQVKMRRI